MSQQSASAPTRSASEAHRAPVDWRRLRGPAAVIALVALAVSSVGPSIAALLAGRLAEHPEGGLVAWLVSVLVGASSGVAVVHVVAALGAATLVALTAATAPTSRPRPEDRPVGTTLRPRRAGYALAMAPVGAAGVVGHVMLGFLA